jgi:TonB family protein
MERQLVRTGILAMIVMHTSATAGAQGAFEPARYVSGQLPVVPPLAISGGEVFLEALVNVDGGVDSVSTLRTTPPFTDVVIKAVRGWRFTPAAEAADSTGQAVPNAPVAGPVFVAAMFTPPTANGQTLGDPPQDLGAASDETPMPVAANPAAYPPRAVGDGAVLVELTIDEVGILTDAQVKVSSPAFDAVALDAARSWFFVAARRHGNAVTTHAYLLFAFRQPVTTR